jgi:hypothetical protein
VSVVELKVIRVLCTAILPTLTPLGTSRNTPTAVITASSSWPDNSGHTMMSGRRLWQVVGIDLNSKEPRSTKAPAGSPYGIPCHITMLLVT